MDTQHRGGGEGLDDEGGGVDAPWRASKWTRNTGAGVRGLDDEGGGVDVGNC